MRAIFKYPLVGENMESDGRFMVKIEMPHTPHIRMVGLQNGIPTMWAEVDPGHEITPFEFWLIGTGREIPEATPYIGTIDMDPMIWHVYGPTGLGVSNLV